MNFRAGYILGAGYNSKAEQDFDLAAVLRFIKSGERQLGAVKCLLLCAPRKAPPAAFLPELAGALGAPLKLCGKAQLAAQAGRCVSFSARAQALYGCGSVAEAAALCGGAALGGGRGKMRLAAPKQNFGALSFAFVVIADERGAQRPERD